jgi:hypothetical protein
MLRFPNFPAALISALVVAGCGNPGSVDQPGPPSFGGAAPVEEEEAEQEGGEPHLGPCSVQGTEMVDLVNAYRAENDLPPIPVSSSMCFVAQTHAEDLAEFKPYEESESCTLQSWSSNTAAKGCCYQSDNSNPECMWEKPQELTDYPTLGYESVVLNPLSPLDAVEHFKGIEAHAELILEQGPWQNVDWKAVGAAFEEGHATLWFGADQDPGL